MKNFLPEQENILLGLLEIFSFSEKNPKPALQKFSPKLYNLTVLRNSLTMPHSDIHSGN